MYEQCIRCGQAKPRNDLYACDQCRADVRRENIRAFFREAYKTCPSHVPMLGKNVPASIDEAVREMAGYWHTSALARRNGP